MNVFNFGQSPTLGAFLVFPDFPFPVLAKDPDDVKETVTIRGSDQTMTVYLTGTVDEE